MNNETVFWYTSAAVLGIAGGLFAVFALVQLLNRMLI